jgi:hypothetical protein
VKFTSILPAPVRLTILALILSVSAAAQSYPVQLNLQLVPPFSGYLPDYATPGNDNFRVLVLFTDFSYASYDLKLKIRIEGQGITIQSKPWYYSGPFTVSPGVPQLLSGSDLSGLLNGNNLDFSGITRTQYDQRKVLPEGFYTITVTAYDFANPLPIEVSNEAVTQAWMVINDPPYLNLPACNSTVQLLTPQQLTFSWTAMNLASPFSALGSEYTFELWEIFPANQAPGNIVASTAPIYSVTTSQTMLNYGIAEPPLVAGREYVWRVRAQDLEGRELFRNNGFSQLCTFHYGSTLNLLGNMANLELHAQVLTHRQARCWWDSLSAYPTYRLEFRKTGSTNWFSLTTSRAAMRIPDLEPNADYEARVSGIFPDGNYGPVSNLVTWHTPLQPLYNCGEQSPPPAVQNFHPLTHANPGMVWQVGQFEMLVVSLNTSMNTGGWYSGLGKIILPFGPSVACSFSAVMIGEDHIMYAGEVRAITEGITEWMTQYSMSQFQYDTSHFCSCTIDSLYVNANGDVVIIDANGNTIIVDIETGGGVLVTDSNGNQWIVNPDGTVTYVTGGFLLPATTDTLSAQEMRILRLAMSDIRTELSANTITGQQTAMLNSKQQLQSHVSAQQQDFPAPPSSPAQEGGEIITFYEADPKPNDAGYQLGSTYKANELAYYSSRVLQVMSREDAPDAELHFIGQYLTVNGVLYKTYVAQQVAQGRSEQQIAADVAQQGVKALVTLTLKKQMSRE